MSVETLRRQRVSGPRLCFTAGLIVLAALWLGPLAPQSHTAFSAHMLLHLGLMLVAAPMLAIELAQHVPTPTSFGEAIGWYLLAGAFEMLIVLGWHVPLLHDAAGRNAPLFAIEQLSFLIASIALWVCVFSARASGAAIAAALVSALTFSHMTMFGLLLALVPKLAYDPNLCQGWAGLGPLDDQHLGGALMATGGLAYLVAAIALFGRVLRRSGEAKMGPSNG